MNHLKRQSLGCAAQCLQMPWMVAEISVVAFSQSYTQAAWSGSSP